ncbi:sugar kinase [Streptomyces mashuensis]|uniref:Sugar kinase n=1 Tax=Streptomyces mashuensis TaxID=33904 RepID=A0A919B3C7_9ACTN|nr:ROK family protein [Streptomyces mashuensis]GHF46549.1 sugar kinase [Streptomyces mashuensis]
MKHVIALDVGGTAIKAALIGADHSLLHETRRPTDRHRGPGAVVEGILALAEELHAHGLRTLGTAAAAAGAAVPGIVDPATGTAVYAANLGWKDVPLRDLLRERLGGIPVALGHDVRTGGLAEGRIGAGRGAGRFLFVPLGTGIAGAIGIDGRIEAGAHGAAGEIGHVAVRTGTDAVACGCGGRGCLETLASAAAVSRAWARVSGDPGADAAACAAAVAAGDPRARAVWQEAVDALADGLIVALSLLDPGTLIIGGGLAEAGETLFAPLREAVRERLAFRTMPRIVPAALGDRAGCLGAGLMAWDALETAGTALPGPRTPHHPSTPNPTTPTEVSA